MPTTPFPAALEAALKMPIQGGKLALLKQCVDVPQFFCCISGNTVGVAKDPVCVLTIPDRVVCIGDSPTVDFSRSWSPTDFLEGTPYTIHWGDGDITNGNFPNPRNPAAETETKPNPYVTEGFFDITMEVADTLGAGSTAILQIYVRDCTQPPNPLPWPRYRNPHYPWAADGMLVADAQQVYYTTDWSALNPAWTACAGAFPAAPENPVNIYDVQLELLNDATTELMYVAAYRGVYEHPMPPNAGTWTLKQLSTDIAVAAGVDSGDLIYYTVIGMKLAISVYEDGWQWMTVECRSNSDALTHKYIVGHTRDGWDTIQHASIVYQFARFAAETQGIDMWEISIDQESDGLFVYVPIARYDTFDGTNHSYLYKSSDYGQTWSLVDTLAGRTYGPGVIVSFSDPEVVYWCNHTTLRKSIDAGGSFATIAAIPSVTTYDYLTTSMPLDTPDICTVVGDDHVYEWDDVALQQELPDVAGRAYGHLVLSEEADGTADAVAWVLITRLIRENQGGAAADKDNLYGGSNCYAIGLPELRRYD